MTTPETTFHSWLFGFLVSIFLTLSGLIIPLFQSLPGWGKGLVIIAALFISALVYQQLATFALNLARRSPRLLKIFLKDKFVGGFWVGWIRTTKGYYVIAVEKYTQTSSTLKVEGESYKNGGKIGAKWESTSASAAPEASYLYMTYKTTIYEKANQTSITEGFGQLTIDDKKLTGRIIDKPQEQTDEIGRKIWVPKGVEYHLTRVTSKKVKNFSEARQTIEWKKTKEHLAEISEEWREMANC